MTGKILGKITSAEYGRIGDYPFLFGLQLTFHLSDGTSIGSGAVYTINISSECRWEENERREAITRNIEFVNSILEDAKVSHISDLINKPVEVTIEKNTFKDFRILTEVL